MKDNLVRAGKWILTIGGSGTVLLFVYFSLLQGTYRAGSWATNAPYTGCKVDDPPIKSGQIRVRGFYPNQLASGFYVISPGIPAASGTFSGPWGMFVDGEGWFNLNNERKPVHADFSFGLHGFEIVFENGGCWVK